LHSSVGGEDHLFKGFMNKFTLQILGVSCGAVILSSCAPTPPKNITNSCSIFQEKSGWYKSMKKSQKKWGTPIHVQLAIMRQESSFKYDAKPKIKYFLWIIPIGRASTAEGYAQVLDGTWAWYRKKTGNRRARRDNFDDATDFIGWYTHLTHKTLHISKWSAYHQYLAYHEGHGGYKRGSYKSKKWLIKIARKVERNAMSYAVQLKGCDLKTGWSLWPF
jgi:hypothetical protein